MRTPPPHLAFGLLAAIVAAAACAASPSRLDPAPLADEDPAADESPLSSEPEPEPQPEPARVVPVHEGSSIARSPSDDALWIADEDHLVLRRVALPIVADDPALEIPLPGAPAQVVALDGRLLVTIRDPGLLLVLRPDPEKGAVEVARVAVPADAWGVAVSPDEKTAIVASAWTHQVTGVDLETAAVRFSLDVPREPRGVVVRPDGASAYVTHVVGAAITRVDGILSKSATVHPVALPAAPLRTSRHAGAEETPVGASLGYAATLSPDGARLFVPRHALGALGKKSWFGMPTVDVLLTGSDEPLVPPRRRDHVGIDHTNDVGVDITLSSDGAVPVQQALPFVQPRAVVYRKSTRTLLVASEGFDEISELDALLLDPSTMPLARYPFRRVDFDHPRRDACGAPSGIALSADESLAYVYCRSTDTLATLPLRAYKGSAASRPLPPTTTVSLAESALDGADPRHPTPDALVALGRFLFYSGMDWNVSEDVGCASCHPDGRDDGHVHQEVEHDGLFSLAGGPIRVPSREGGGMTISRGHPRQTPMLAGRVDADGPYGWHGESSTLEKRIQASFGIHRWFGSTGAAEQAERDDEPSRVLRARAIAAFLRRGLVPPPHEDRPLTAQEKHGRDLFFLPSTGCSSCHTPEGGYTDRMAVSLGATDDVPGVLEEPDHRFKTPSLRFVGGTAPYFHDGRAPTLEALVDQNDDRMGHTNQLSRRDRAALVAFLRTL